MSLGKRVAQESGRNWAAEHREMARRNRDAYPHIAERWWFERLALAHEAAALAFEALLTDDVEVKR